MIAVDEDIGTTMNTNNDHRFSFSGYDLTLTKNKAKAKERRGVRYDTFLDATVRIEGHLQPKIRAQLTCTRTTQYPQKVSLQKQVRLQE